MDIEEMVATKIEQLRANGDLLECESEWRDFWSWRYRDEEKVRAMGPDDDWWLVPDLNSQMVESEILNRLGRAACKLVLSSRELARRPVMNDVFAVAGEYIERCLADRAYLSRAGTQLIIETAVVAERIGMWPRQPFPQD